MHKSNTHARKIKIQDFWLPLLFAAIMWTVKIIEPEYSDFYKWGIYPRNPESLIHIITAPFIHGSWNHLINNTVPVLILGSVLFYFYKPVAVKIFFWIWLMSGLWLWALARPSYHIGASGIVYGLASFIFFSGIFRKYYKLIAISLLVVFLYGSMIWGIFPLKKEISFEAHFYGFVAGLILAYYFRKEGPQKPVYEWELEDDGDEEYEDGKPHPKEPHHHNPHVKVHYHITKKNNDNNHTNLNQ